MTAADQTGQPSYRASSTAPNTAAPARAKRRNIFSAVMSNRAMEPGILHRGASPEPLVT